MTCREADLTPFSNQGSPDNLFKLHANEPYRSPLGAILKGGSESEERQKPVVPLIHA